MNLPKDLSHVVSIHVGGEWIDVRNGSLKRPEDVEAAKRGKGHEGKAEDPDTKDGAQAGHGGKDGTDFKEEKREGLSFSQSMQPETLTTYVDEEEVKGYRENHESRSRAAELSKQAVANQQANETAGVRAQAVKDTQLQQGARSEQPQPGTMAAYEQDAKLGTPVAPNTGDAGGADQANKDKGLTDVSANDKTGNVHASDDAKGDDSDLGPAHKHRNKHNQNR